MKIDTIMIFAAGFGSRMNHITKTIPKPLVPINGKPILYYAIENAIRHGFKRIIINSHYMADKVKKAIDYFKENTKNCPEIILLYEDIILETGGGLKNALSIIDREVMFTSNSDVIIRTDNDFFASMESAWNSKIMDLLMLIQKTENVVGYSGGGEFEMNESGQLSLKPAGFTNYKYLNTGTTIIKTSLIASNPEDKFSLREYFDDGITKLYGHENIGEFFHLSSPENLEEIERIIKIKSHQQNHC